VNAKLEELIKDLLIGTRDGIFKWTETAEPGVYRLMLDKGLVRIYHVGPLSAGEDFVGITVLDAKGKVLTDVQVPRQGADNLVALYDLVDGSFQQGALDDLLAEVRMKMQSHGRPATAGQR
jgi:hypothetical protein